MSALKAFARDLQGADIGATVWFDWTFPQSDVSARVSGKIDKIVHHGKITTLDVVDDFAKSTEQPMVRIAALYPGPQSDSYIGTLRLVVTTEEQ